MVATVRDDNRQRAVTTHVNSSRSSRGENSPPAWSLLPGWGGKKMGDPLVVMAPTVMVLASIVVLQSDQSDVLENRLWLWLWLWLPYTLP